MSKKQGTVKWFSNKKGYGFITPEGADESSAEDIFVHQSSITSDGYRTLGEGWVVEFDVVKDESDGKVKAENVTAPGGGPCTGPRKKRFSKGPRNENGGGEGGGGSGSFRRDPKPQWHDVLTADVKESLTNKSIRHTTGTIDVSHGSERIKLGTQGYTSMAHADAILAEGSFTCDENGLVTFTWDRALKFDNSDWTSYDVKELVQTITLTDDDVGQVGQDESAETLWGDAPTDPRDAFESNGFQMRRVVLTPRRSSYRGGGSRRQYD